MDRRAAILAVGGTLIAVPFAGRAQKPTQTWHVGLRQNTARAPHGAPLAAFRQAIEALGYLEAKNMTYVGRWSHAQSARLPRLGAELGAFDGDVILTTGAPAAAAAKGATATIPVVVVVPGDALATGLVASLGRPGGNVTGISDPGAELSAKRLELLKDAVPSATRVAVLWNASDQALTLRHREIEKAAPVLHVTLRPLGVRETRRHQRRPGGADARSTRGVFSGN